MVGVLCFLFSFCLFNSLYGLLHWLGVLFLLCGNTTFSLADCYFFPLPKSAIGIYTSKLAVGSRDWVGLALGLSVWCMLTCHLSYKNLDIDTTPIIEASWHGNCDQAVPLKLAYGKTLLIIASLL